MTTIEAVGEVGPDHRLVIELPQDVPEGRHRVVVTLLDESEHRHERSKGELEWEGDVLVYNGPIPCDLDIRKLIELNREDRMLHVLLGPSE
ncbi:MAG: hypothetical protein WD069_00310 [Planctomycetales bacterium]